MKITNVTPMTMGTDWRNITFVKVETDEGLVGVADARVLNRTEAVIGYLKEAVPRYVLGHDPFDIEQLVHRMYLEDFGRAGELVMTGIALIEIACWDIMGQALGQPVYRLLGGAVRDKVKAYANGWYTVERTPGRVPRRGHARDGTRLSRRSSSTPLARASMRSSRPTSARWSAWWRPCAMRWGRTWTFWSRCTGASTR